VMDAMIYNTGFLGKLQKKILDEPIAAFQSRLSHHQAGAKVIASRLCRSLRQRRREILFHLMFPKYLKMLDRIKYGFIPEANYFPARAMPPNEKYDRFWFKNDKQVHDVFLKNQCIIGLDNSWTPQWYKDLSEKEIFDNGCLLSRTLKVVTKNG